jgi:hypothetical protein
MLNKLCAGRGGGGAGEGGGQVSLHSCSAELMYKASSWQGRSSGTTAPCMRAAGWTTRSTDKVVVVGGVEATPAPPPAGYAVSMAIWFF